MEETRVYGSYGCLLNMKTFQFIILTFLLGKAQDTESYPVERRWQEHDKVNQEINKNEFPEMNLNTKVTHNDNAEDLFDKYRFIWGIAILVVLCVLMIIVGYLVDYVEIWMNFPKPGAFIKRRRDKKKRRGISPEANVGLHDDVNSELIRVYCVQNDVSDRLLPDSHNQQSMRQRVAPSGYQKMKV